MSKVKILFFAADPLSIAPDAKTLRLRLDEDMRSIQEEVDAAEHGCDVEFGFWPATRTKDLMKALRRDRPHIVHFSGHGTAEGLVLVGHDGERPHLVRKEALVELFGHFRGDIRLVVLNACFSLSQAEAIAQCVGCAIGTRRAISDAAAITFATSLYHALASGESVQTAFDQARLALSLEHFEERDCPELVVRADVHPSELVLVSSSAPPETPSWQVRGRIAAATAACVLTAAFTLLNSADRRAPVQQTASDVACGAEFLGNGILPLSGGPSAASAQTPANPDGAAASLADAKAFYRVGNYAAAVPAFERAAHAGSGTAMGCLGTMYMYGKGIPAQPTVGFGLVHDAALIKRDPHAMYALAVAYLNGIGTSPREHLARDWFEKAARDGFPEAMRSLGGLYEAGMNDSSYQKALDWYRQAERAGLADAGVDIGRMYELGLGVHQDWKEAFRRYQSAARLRSPRGMFAVGQAYQKGVGVPRNYAAAMAWYRKAASAGSADAMNSVGVLYDRGLGVRRSHAAAARWYRRAADAGSPLAKGNLGAFGPD